MDTSFDRPKRFALSTPRAWLKFLEVRSIAEALALAPAAPVLAAQPRGDGRQVMVLPGFAADDRSTAPLRWYLGTLGYEALPWGLGVNKGRPEHDAERLLRHLGEVRDAGAPVTLIGWSLGGVVARLVARHEPAAVREVITLGTPVEGGPKYTAAGARFARRQGLDLDAFERHVHEVNSEGVVCPLTIIYSRSDGIVAWRAAIDRYNRHARHIRVAGSHLGLGLNPRVWRIIAQTLNSAAARHRTQSESAPSERD